MAAPKPRSRSTPQQVQPKLKVGGARDACEREADAMASFVLSMRPEQVGAKRAPAPAARQADSVVQRACSSCDKDDEVRPKLVTDSASHEARGAQHSGVHAPASFEADLQALRRLGGRPLALSTRNFFEPRFSANFSDVRVYTGTQANRIAASIDARAFTHGSDIVFANGQFSTTPQGLSLLAHELTHTLQQRSAHEPRGRAELTSEATTIRRAPCSPLPPATQPADFPACYGTRDKNNKIIKFDALLLPIYKSTLSPFGECSGQYAKYKTLKRAAGYERENKTLTNPLTPAQAKKWQGMKDHPKGGPLRKRALDLRSDAYALLSKERELPAKRGFYFTNPATGGTFGAPTWDGAKTELISPTWSNETTPKTKNFQIDHIVELQLANWTKNVDASSNQRAAELSNLWLLEQSANGSAGSKIADEMEKRVDAHVNASVGKDNPARDTDYFLDHYALHFSGHTTGLKVIDPKEADVWQKSQIWNAEHLAKVGASDRTRALDSAGSSAPASARWFNIRLFRTANITSSQKDFEWKSTGGETTLAPRGEELSWDSVLGEELRLKSMTLTVGPDITNQTELGYIEVNILADNPDWKPFDQDRRINIVRTPGALYAGYIKDKGVYSLHSTKNARHAKTTSPSEVTALEVTDKSYRLEGNILPELPIFHAAGAAGEPLRIPFVETASASSRDQLKIKNTRLDESNLALPAGLETRSIDMGFREGATGHLEVYGGLEADIAHVGHLHAQASLDNHGLHLSGEFDGTGVFQGLNTKVEYSQYQDDAHAKAGRLKVDVHHTIPVGTIPYLKAAEIHLAIDNTQVTCDGSFSIPETRWLQSDSRVTFSFDNGSLTVGGSARLKDGLIPGVSAAEMRFEGRFVKNSLDLLARASAEFDTSAVGFPIKSLRPIHVEAIWKNGEITVGGTVSVNTELASAAMTNDSAAGSFDPDDGGSSFHLENAEMSLYVTSRALGDQSPEEDVVPRLNDYLEPPATAPGQESKELAWWGHGEVDLSYGEYVGLGLGVDVSRDNLWTLSGNVRFGRLATLMKAVKLLDIDKTVIDLATFGLPSIPLGAGGFGVGLSVGAEIEYEADIWVGPVTVDQAQLSVQGTLGIPNSLTISGSAGLRLAATGGAAVRMGAKASVGLEVLGLNLASVTGKLVGELSGKANAEAEVVVTAAWSPNTGLCIGDLGADFGVDVQFAGRLYAEVDVSLLWWSILKEEVTLAKIDGDARPDLKDIFGSANLPDAPPNGGGQCLGEGLSPDQFSTGLRDSFQKGEVSDYVHNIVNVLGGRESSMKADLDNCIDPEKLEPERSERATRLAEVIKSGSADRYARRYGLQKGGTVAVDIFDEPYSAADLGKPRHGMLIMVTPQRKLVVADLYVLVLDPATDWLARGVQQVITPPPLRRWSLANPDLLSREQVHIRVLEISPFFDEAGHRSYLTATNGWEVGRYRKMSRNPVDDSPLTQMSGPGYDCPNCHTDTQPTSGPPTFDFNSLNDPSFVLDGPTRLTPLQGGFDPSQPQALDPRFDFTQMGKLTLEQQRDLIKLMEVTP